VSATGARGAAVTAPVGIRHASDTAAALFRDTAWRIVSRHTTTGGSTMTHSLAAWIGSSITFTANRLRGAREQSGQGTVEYAGLAMAIGVLLLALGSYLSGKDHGIGSVVTGAVKEAIKQASGGK
jgi:Flp pilus assembly pilin Flp